jgi:hypothetical protein
MLCRSISYIENLVVLQALGGNTVDDLKCIREDKVLFETLGGTPGKTSDQDATFIPSGVRGALFNYK